jgi:hypothetical protein
LRAHSSQHTPDGKVFHGTQSIFIDHTPWAFHMGRGAREEACRARLCLPPASLQDAKPEQEGQYEEQEHE